MTGLDDDLADVAGRYADEFTSTEDLVELAKARFAWRARRGFKVCGTCRLPKPVGDFGRDASRRDGLEARCRPCRSTRVNA